MKKRNYTPLKIVIVIFALSFSSFMAAGNELENELKKIKTYLEKNNDTALLILDNAYKKYGRSATELEKGKVFEFYAKVYEAMEENQIALDYYLKAKAAYESLDSLRLATSLYPDIGVIYYWLGEYGKATDAYMQGVKAADKNNDKNTLARCFQNMGMLYSAIGENKLTLKYYNKALELSNQIPNFESNKAGILQNIGITYANQGELESAISYYKKSLSIYNQLDEAVNMAITYNNLGVLFERKQLSDSTIFYYKKALDVFYKIDFKRGISISLSNIGNIYKEEMRNELALEYLFKSLEVAEEIKLADQIQSTYNDISMAYENMDNCEESLHYLILAYDWSDTVFTIEQASQIMELETKYETEKKEQQILLQETKLREKSLRNIGLTGISILALLLALLIYINLRSKKKLNAQLRDSNNLLAHKNDQITSSITYASFIQAAILPPLSLFDEYFSENFILFKPKDIVSGDFYWIEKVNSYVVIAAVDCTGHGVPGAFMSMLGISFLNEIVQKRVITQANQVLNELRKLIKHSLKQHGGKDATMNGMDMALCILDTKTNIMQFAGAYNPLVLITEKNGVNELQEIKADRMPVGFYHGKEKTFTNHEIQLKMGDAFYLYSDGFMDQMGGVEGGKFMSKNFKQLLNDIHENPMQEQKKILENTITKWMNGTEQMDDMLVIGVRV